MRKWLRSSVLLLLGMGCAAVAETPAPPLSVTVIVTNANLQPYQPVRNVRVSLTHMQSSQSAIDAQGPTNPRGEAKLVVSQGALKRDLRIVISGVDNLVIFQPADGQLNGLPAVIKVTLLPRATAKLLEEPGLVQALLRRMSMQIARQQKTIAALENQDNAAGDESGQMEKPDLGAALEQWASVNGFSADQVNKMVQAWTEEIHRKGGAATKDEMALAELALKHYAAAQQLFHQARDADIQEAGELDRQQQALEARKKAHEEELKADEAAQQALQDKLLDSWQGMLDHSKQEADTFQSNGQFHEAALTLESAATTLEAVHNKNPDEADLHELWLSAVSDAVTALSDEEDDQVESEMFAGKTPVGVDSAALLAKAAEDFKLLDREYSALGEHDDAESAETNLGDTEDQLGDLLASEAMLASGDKAVALYDQAVAADRNALDVYTKSGNTQKQLSTQLDLASIYLEESKNASGSRAETLQAEASQAYQTALGSLNSNGLSSGDRAEMEVQLGIAIDQQGGPTSRQRALVLFDQAVHDYQSELASEAKKLGPGAFSLDRQQWGRTQRHLGDALRQQAERATGDNVLALFDQAVQAYRHAHEADSSDNPENWGEIEIARGDTLREESNRAAVDQALDLLHQSEQAYRNALKAVKKDQADWDEANSGLGSAYLVEGELTEGDKGIALLDEAVKIYQEQLATTPKQKFPAEWSESQLIIGMVLSNESMRVGDDNALTLLNQALKGYDDILSLIPNIRQTPEWAVAQFYLAYLMTDTGARQQGDQAAASFGRAQQALNDALPLAAKLTSPSIPSRMQLSVATLDLVAGHFDACVERAQTVVNTSSAPFLAVMRDAVKLACQWGVGKKSAALEIAKAIQPEAASASGILRTTFGWNSPAAVYFMSHSPSFANGRAAWVALFSSLGRGDSAGMTAALHQLEPILQQ